MRRLLMRAGVLSTVLLLPVPLVAQETVARIARGNGEATLTVFDGRPLERAAQTLRPQAPFVLGLLVSPTAIAQTSEDPPLRLLLECFRQPALNFKFTLENVSTAPVAAGIGSILGNDKTFLPENLELRIRRADMPITTATYFDPAVPGIAGAIEPWVVRLPVGASYSVRIPATFEQTTPPNGRETFAETEDLQLHMSTRRRPTAEAAQRLRLQNVWVGGLTSEWIRFPNDCRTGK